MVFKTLCNYQLFGSAKTNFTSRWGKILLIELLYRTANFLPKDLVHTVRGGNNLYLMFTS